MKALEQELELNLIEIEPLYEVIHIQQPDINKTFVSVLEIREYENQYSAILQIRHQPIAIIDSKDPIYSRLFERFYRTQFNKFQVSVDKIDKKVRFGPIGNIIVSPSDLRGLGIGTHAFNKLIKWLKNKFPDYSVHYVEIASIDGEDDNNKNRRNQFYSHHGFIAKYDDPNTKKSGFFLVDKVGELKIHETNKIEVQSVYEIMRDYNEMHFNVPSEKTNLIATNNYLNQENNILFNSNKKLKIFSFLLALALAVLFYCYMN